MLYTELKIGDKELKLRLSTRDIVALEKALGGNPLDKLIAVSENKLPEISFIVTVIHQSLQKYQKGYTLDKTYDLIDEYVDEGGTLLDLIQIITEIFKVSGFFKMEEAPAK